MCVCVCVCVCMFVCVRTRMRMRVRVCEICVRVVERYVICFRRALDRAALNIVKQSHS